MPTAVLSGCAKASPVTAEDIEYVTSRVGAFGKDNRAGIERTLHRISAIRNRQGKIVGLTCRIGRAVYGTIDIIRDVVESGKVHSDAGPSGPGQDHQTARSRPRPVRRVQKARHHRGHVQ